MNNIKILLIVALINVILLVVVFNNKIDEENRFIYNKEVNGEIVYETEDNKTIHNISQYFLYDDFNTEVILQLKGSAVVSNNNGVYEVEDVFNIEFKPVVVYDDKYSAIWNSAESWYNVKKGENGRGINLDIGGSGYFIRTNKSGIIETSDTFNVYLTYPILQLAH